MTKPERKLHWMLVPRDTMWWYQYDGRYSTSPAVKATSAAGQLRASSGNAVVSDQLYMVCLADCPVVKSP